MINIIGRKTTTSCLNSERKIKQSFILIGIFAVVYKYLKSQKGYKYTFDDLYFELANYLTYGQLAFALDAFEEAGLIKREGNITLNDVKTKANLERTDTLMVLKGRL